MGDEIGQVNEVIDAMGQLVARDGGTLRLSNYQPGGATVEVQYTVGKNDECETCLISPEMLRDFLLEGFRARELGVEDVQVATE
jgi:Fe-S cluster biogenesis protein NfuA